MTVGLARPLREILGCYATGIVVVTTRAMDGQHLGVTVNSFTSLSLSPPLIMFSLARSANISATFERASAFSINVLSLAQQRLSSMFAKPSTARWDDVHYRIGRNGCALLDGSLAYIECAKYQTLEGGDHLIYVGNVTRHERGLSGQPLVFFKGRYGAYVRDTAALMPPDDSSLAEFAVAGWG